MFWCGETIAEWAPRYRIVEPFDEGQIDCAAYTLRVGPEYFVTPDHRSQSFSEVKKRRVDYSADGRGASFTIPAGQFSYIMTEECITIPRHMLGFISLKAKKKFEGLINVSGFHVDPGWSGHLIYAVYNAGPRAINLSRGDDLFLIWFAELDKVQYDRKYSKNDDNAQSSIPSSLVSSSSDPIYSMQTLAREFDTLRNQVRTIWILGGLASFALTVALTVAVNWSTISGWFSPSYFKS